MACQCNIGLSNTGTSCTPIAEVAKKLIIVEYFKADGSVNSIDLGSATFNSAFFTAKVNHADPKLRWYPLPNMKNVTSERAEPITEGFDDGSVAFIGQGTKSFKGIIVNGTPQLAKSLESVRCVEIGVYVVDKTGNLLGSGVVDGFLQPFKLDKDSFSVRVVGATDKTVQKIEVSYNYSIDEKDENVVMVTAEEMTFSPVNLQGLLDISATYSNISTTGFKAKLSTQYGTPLNPVLDEGLLITDFSLYNVNDALSVTILTMTESPAGTYAFTFAAQGSTEKLRLTPSKNGRDYTAVKASLITIP
jgi:hypothetical protein